MPHAVSSTEENAAMQTWSGQVDKNFRTNYLKIFILGQNYLKIFILGQNFSENFCPRIKIFRTFSEIFYPSYVR